MSKKGKKAKTPLTDEEQLLLFQQRLLADEEVARRKERLLSVFLKVMLPPYPCPAHPLPALTLLP